ncbi:MAG: hypothetical protein GXP50_02330 [Deltaproteobacteria bacterium]|nr:hypothetical protein [Deltaproteobacteria bacterium]
MECQKEKNEAQCTCTYPGCPRHGLCCQCIAYHRSKNQMVACYFKPEVERTYDRSMQNFLSQFR